MNAFGNLKINRPKINLQWVVAIALETDKSCSPNPSTAGKLRKHYFQNEDVSYVTGMPEKSLIPLNTSSPG